MELYWRWTYTCLYCLAVIPILYTVSLSPLESPLALESLLESLLQSQLDSLLKSLLHSLLETLLERAMLENCASGEVEFSTGSFWPMENSEFVKALANRSL
jgi:hypothetical protein